MLKKDVDINDSVFNDESMNEESYRDFESKDDGYEESEEYNSEL